MNFISGLADIILDRFQRQKLVLDLFSKQLYLKGSNFAFGLKASRVLAMSLFLLSLFDCFSFFFGMILSVFWLALLICWSGRVFLSFPVNSLDCFLGIVLHVFLFCFTF